MLLDSKQNEYPGEALHDAKALFSKLKLHVKADYNSKGQVAWRKRRARRFSISTPANRSMRTIRRFC